MAALATNEPVLQARLSDGASPEGVASTIERGYRAVTVQITDAPGVAGLIQAKSQVDVIFTRPGSIGLKRSFVRVSVLYSRSSMSCLTANHQSKTRSVCSALIVTSLNRPRTYM